MLVWWSCNPSCISMRAPQRDICQEKLTEHLLCQLEPLKVGEDWSLDNMEKPGASRRRLLQRSLPSICKPGDSFPRRLRRKLVKKLWEAATDDKSSSLERRKKKYNYSMSSSFQRILFSSLARTSPSLLVRVISLTIFLVFSSAWVGLSKCWKALFCLIRRWYNIRFSWGTTSLSADSEHKSTRKSTAPAFLLLALHYNKESGCLNGIESRSSTFASSTTASSMTAGRCDVHGRTSRQQQRRRRRRYAGDAI